MTTSGGSILTATIDPKQDFLYTNIEIDAGTPGFVEVHINRAASPSLPRIPSAGELRAWIGVAHALPIASLEDVNRMMATTMLPLAAMRPDDLALRQSLETGLGEALNWDLLEANLKRDIPKLRRALPLP